MTKNLEKLRHPLRAAKYFKPPAIKPEKPIEHWNELDVARQIKKSELLAYDPGLKIFECYNPANGLWEIQTDHKIRARVLAHLVVIDGQKDTSIAPLTVTKLVGAVCTILKYNLPEPSPRNLKHLVAVKNGVLDLGDDATSEITLLKHNANFHLTNGSPVDYVPKSQCSKFKEILLANAFTNEDCNLIQRYFGSALLGTNDSQCILVIKGNAGVGKSTLVTILETVLGLSNVAQLRTQHLSGRFEMSSYLGKSLLVGKDVSADFLSCAGARALKSLVGGDLLQAERKSHNNRIDFHGKFHVVITSNRDLRIPIEGDQEAWRRRLLVVNSEEPRPGRIIPNLSATLLQKEAPGILNWLIEGAFKHRDEMTRLGQYYLSARQQTNIETMIENS